MKTIISLSTLGVCSLIALFLFLQNSNQNKVDIPESLASSESRPPPSTQQVAIAVEAPPVVEAEVVEDADVVVITEEEPVFTQTEEAPAAALPDWRYGAMIAHQQVLDGYVDGLLYLVSEIEVSQDEEVRLALADILGYWNNPEYIDLVVDLGASTPDGVVRVALMQATANMLSGEELHDLLPEYLNAESDDFRTFVDNAVWMIDHSNANRWLLEFVDRPLNEKTISLGERALSALASQGNSRLLKKVIDIARAPGHPLHEGALNTLGNVSAERLFTTIVREAEGAGGEATAASREAAIRSLRLFDSDRAMPALKSMLMREGNSNVINVIRETLGEIESMDG